MQAESYQHLMDVKNVEAGILDRQSVIDEERDLEVVRQVCDFYRVLKENQVPVPEIYRPGGEWDVYIKQRESVYGPIRDGDVGAAAEIFRNFWRNDLGPIVSNYAYYSDLVEGNEAKIQRFMKGMSRDYEVWERGVDGDPAELEVPGIGNPWGYMVNGRLITPQALRFHNHSRQILDLVSDIDRPLIAEIGGGYGGMAWYLHRLGNGLCYVDLDLPETLVIAAYYLLSVCPDKKILLYDPTIELQADLLLSYDMVLLPNYVLPQMPDLCADLTLNAFSLSEMPFATIAEYIRQIQRICSGYFLTNNVDKAGVVNRGHERTPVSKFPVDRNIFKRVYKKFDVFQGHEGDYQEILFERIRH